MRNTSSQYNNKTAKLKVFSKKNLLRKIYPSKTSHEIPDDFLSKSGYTKSLIVKDLHRLIDCNCHVSYINRRIKKEKKIHKSIKIFDTNHCNIYALCPICAEKVSRRRRERYRDDIKRLAARHEKIYMVTFTVRPAKTFNEAYKRLTFAIRKYVLMGQLRGAGTNGAERRSRGEAAKIKAMALSKEIKIGRDSGLWHLHAHAIVFTDIEIDYSVFDTKKKKLIIKDYKERFGRSPKKEELAPAVKKWHTLEIVNTESGEIKETTIPVSKASMEWVKATGNTGANVHFSPMKGDPDSIYSQCIEVIKYTSKVSDFTREQILEILVNRKGKRFFSTYGSLYNIEKEEAGETEQLLENTGLEGFVWSREKDRLVRMNKREMADVEFKYANQDKLYEAKSKIMKGYHLKEDVKKKIIKEYEHRRRGDRKGLLEYKATVIMSIDDLESAYTMYKRKTYKLYMNIQSTGRDEIDMPSPIQRHFLKDAFLFIREETKNQGV